ncbi:hypothetical protein STEG23_016859, partial [Scotinomys teguina]
MSGKRVNASGPNRGHYITIVKSHGFWLLFDDDIVEVEDLDSVPSIRMVTHKHFLKDDHTSQLLIKRQQYHQMFKQSFSDVFLKFEWNIHSCMVIISNWRFQDPKGCPELCETPPKRNTDQPSGTMKANRMAWGHFIEKVTWASVLKKVRKKAMGKRVS